jgi:glycosyltransferase involved in cell wall biosynthesis
MRERRVLHVFKYFRPHFTGEGTFFERIVPEFRRLRPDVRHDVLATLTDRPQGAPVVVDEVGSISFFHARSNKNFATFVELFWWSLRNVWRYDTVHYHTHVDRTFASYWLAKLLGLRIVLSATLDDSAPGIAKTYRARYRSMARALLRCFDMFVSISPKLHEETVAELGPDRARLIPMGIVMPKEADIDRARARCDLRISNNARILVSIGGISTRKDQLTLVKAMPALLREHPSVQLVLVGPVLEPAYANLLEQTIDAHGLRENVRLAGWIERPWPYYEAADLMVFASREEGFGTVMIEAMSYALPVVARRLAGINDVFIKCGQTGYLFDNESEYSVLVARLLANEEERRRLGREAREFVLPRFAMKGIAKRYLEVYGFPAGDG